MGRDGRTDAWCVGHMVTEFHSCCCCGSFLDSLVFGLFIFWLSDILGRRAAYLP